MGLNYDLKTFQTKEQTYQSKVKPIGIYNVCKEDRRNDPSNYQLHGAKLSRMRSTS